MNAFSTKMKMKKILLSILLVWAGVSLGYAQLRLPALFTNGMVLQQQDTVPVWGWANPGAEVKVKASWSKQVLRLIANNEGKWKGYLLTPAADFKHHTLQITADTTFQVENILLGEVWVCSGQSNMEMPVKGFKNQPVYGSSRLIAGSLNEHIRHFEVKMNFSNQPLDSCEGSWKQASPATTPNFSAVGYVFSKLLNEALNVPIGIINTTWGGTPAEAWTDKPTLQKDFKEIDLGILETDSFSHKSPTVLYNAMVNPIVGYRIKGVIWYQGEGNVSRPKQYERLFPAMITCWRRNWQQGNFPFYYVQICPMQSYDRGKRESYRLREAQLKTMERVPNTGMVSTLDIGDQWGIHPPRKIEVGERLAYWALNKQYGFTELQCGGPLYKSMEIQGNKALIEFKNAPLGITTLGKELTGFEVAGADRKFYPAEAAIKIEWGKPAQLRRPLVEVWSDKVAHPVAVRYGWSNWVEGALFDTAGNPASSFRTDNWDE